MVDIQNITALVVDDSSTMVRIIVNTLKTIGILPENILTAEHGKEGFDKYIQNKQKLDIILTDWNMPIMNGLEFVKKIREDDKDIRIIMITTESGKIEVITALKSGVNNYIAKPFNHNTLKDKLLDVFQH